MKLIGFLMAKSKSLLTKGLSVLWVEILQARIKELEANNKRLFRDHDESAKLNHKLMDEMEQLEAENGQLREDIAKMAGAKLVQDNSKGNATPHFRTEDGLDLFWDDSDKRLVPGTKSPSTALHVAPCDHRAKEEG